MTKKEREELQKEKFRIMREFDIKAAGMAGADACIIAGIDEAGRGPLAGPVTAACVVLGQDFDVMGIDDSKKISEKRREELFGQITSKALAYGVGMADNNVIDQINILNATKQAMKEAVISASDMLEQRTGKKIGLLLIDAVALEDIKIPQQAIIKGDAKSLSIAAASIIAKVTRDRFMLGCHQQYPQYGFDKNKGYGTKSHYEAIAQNGITPIHRKTFLKNIL